MDERQRRIFEKAYAILDRREDDEREHREWLASHVDKYGILNLGQDEEIVEPSPQLQQPASSALPLTDAMLDRRIDNMSGVVAKALDNLHKMILSQDKEIAELREQTAALRADLTITRTIVAGRNVFGVVRKETNRDVA